VSLFFLEYTRSRTSVTHGAGGSGDRMHMTEDPAAGCFDQLQAKKRKGLTENRTPI
jgi:hypothetical protein